MRVGLLVNGRLDLTVDNEAVSTFNGRDGLLNAYCGEKDSAGELRFNTSLWLDMSGILDPP